MGNAAASALGKMFRRQSRTPLVVGQERQCLRVVALAEDVDHWQANAAKVDRRTPVHPSCGDDQPVDLLGKKLVKVGTLAFGIVGGVHHEDADAGL